MSSAPSTPAVNLLMPPRGAWFSDDGVEVRVGASTRSIPQALFLLPVGAVFCLIGALFIAFSVISFLQAFGVASPASGPPGSIGGSVCVLLFAAPIAGVGLWVLWTAAMAIGGRVAVTLRGDDLDVFTGIGPIGRRRRISAASVAGVIDHEQVIRTSRGATRRRVILFQVPGTDGIMFGAALNQRRREFMIASLRRSLGR